MGNLFDGLGGKLVAPIMARMNAAAEAEAVDILNPLSDSCNLVIGFGPGVGIAKLTERTPYGSVLGIDPSLAMLRTATNRNRAAISAGNVKLATTTADKIPCAEACFDGAIAVHTLQLCEPIEATITELARVMKTNALLVTITHDWAAKHHRGSAKIWTTTMVQALEEGGFENVLTGFAHADKGKAILITSRRCRT
jgi:ubiquinone/menaquinone biosynthesis C-methylase UbiE